MTDGVLAFLLNRGRPPPLPGARRNRRRRLTARQRLTDITTAAAVSVVRLRLFIAPLSTKTVGRGGGLRRNLTLFDFEREQITQIVSRLMDGLTLAGWLFDAAGRTILKATTCDTYANSSSRTGI